MIRRWIFTIYKRFLRYVFVKSKSIKSDRTRSSRNAIRIRDGRHCILVCDKHQRMSENNFTAADTVAVVVDDGINDNQFVLKN